MHTSSQAASTNVTMNSGGPHTQRISVQQSSFGISVENRREALKIILLKRVVHDKDMTTSAQPKKKKNTLKKLEIKYISHFFVIPLQNNLTTEITHCT